MALVVNTNIASITAQNYATSSRKEMETAMERLSSGLRINSAADDAAGLAISTRMDSQIRGMTKAVQNANDAISLTQTAEGAQKEITEMLQRIRELAIQAANSSNNDTDRTSLDAEVQQLIAEIDQIAENTKFNNQKLLNGQFGAQIQIGDAVGQQMEFDIDSMKSGDLGLGGAGSVAGSDVLIGSRVETSDTGLVNTSGVAEGDILINGQELGSLTAADDIQDIVKVINESIDNVEASAFNTVVMKSVGSGVAAAGNVTITVTPVTATDDSGLSTALAFVVNQASASMEELVANINEATQGYVTASVNRDGVLVLANDTGARIKVADASSNGSATGIGSESGTVFGGFLKIQSTDGSAIRIEKGNTSASAFGSDDDLEAIGFRQVGVDNGFGTDYSVLGASLSSAQATAAIGVNDLKINGVDVYNSDITTTSVSGKIDAINAVSEETGVSASAYFEKYYDMSTAIAAGATWSAGVVTLNGATVAASGTMSTFATAINAKSSITGVSAEARGNTLKLFGNVSALTVAYSTATMTTAFGAEGSTYGGIRLDSVNDRPFSIDLGESNATTSTAAAGPHYSLDYLGFKELNVGAADYDSNAPMIGGSAGSSVSGLSIATEAGAFAAIDIIDSALDQVSASAADLGAVQNRLGHVLANLQETIVNTEASKSRIMDADFAVESAKLAKQQVMQQAATAMLAQANAAPQSVLTLLGG